MDSGDDMPVLPADTLALLQDFQKTQVAQLEAFKKLQDKAESRFDDADTQQQRNPLEDDDADESEADSPLQTMEFFTEDWNLSQFWYTDLTARTLSAFVLDPLVKVPLDLNSIPIPHPEFESMPDIKIAIISAPTVHQYLTYKILPLLPQAMRRKIKCVVLEHDSRFALFGNQFVHYDFNEPTRLPGWSKGAFTGVIIDPPFLSTECQVKTAITARLLLPKVDNDEERRKQKVVVCTGQKVEDVILRTYKNYGIRRTSFDPEHRNGLANEFRCFANSEIEGVWSFTRT
ncbi:putative N6-adenine methyltransferase-domain-containing protein [Lipomyces arxii]|uniref:putative N6-adenine methyltransferase-domain-containing protein n=1 Tax=Lipomyces arxii TaxID=56418 RepID=UPI0034CEBFC6